MDQKGVGGAFSRVVFPSSRKDVCYKLLPPDAAVLEIKALTACKGCEAVMQLLEQPQTVYGGTQDLTKLTFRRMQCDLSACVGTLSDAQKQSVWKQLCVGVNFMHAQRVAHLDLKLENVLVDFEEGEKCVVRITDFGLSMTDLDPDQLVEACPRGTVWYVAPEVVARRAYNPFAADAYSFGILIFALFLGKFPYDIEKPSYQRFGEFQIRHRLTPLESVVKIWPTFVEEVFKLPTAVQIFINSTALIRPEERLKKF